MAYKLRNIVDLAVKGGYVLLDRKHVGYDDQPDVEYPDFTAHYECGQDGRDVPYIDIDVESKRGCLCNDRPISNLDMILSKIKARKTNGLYGWSDSYVDKSHYQHFDTDTVPSFTNIDKHTDDDPDY